MADIYLAGQSAKPGSQSVLLVNDTTLILKDIDFGNAAWEILWSGPRGTQGARAAGATPQNRPLVFDIRVVGASSDDLQAKLSPIYTLFDELRRFGGTITWRPKGGTYRQHFDVLAGQARVEDYDSQLYGRLNQVIVRCEAICAPYLKGDPMDIADDFSTDRLSEYTVDTGAISNVAIAAGELDAVANLTVENRLIHTFYGYDYGDHQGTVKATPGATISSFKAGVVLKRKDNDDYLVVYVDDNATNSRLRLDVVTGGSVVNRSSTNLGARIVAGTPFWVRGRIEGNVVYLEYFLASSFPSGPTPMGTPTTSASYVLVGAEVTNFGAAVIGKAGLVWIPQHTDAKLDDFSLEPYTYRNISHPETLPLRGAIPGDGRALFDLEVTTSGGSRYPKWALFGWWLAPSGWNMVWGGDFEDAISGAQGWSNAAVTNINGAATSVARVTTAAKYGVGSGQIVCPATTDTGANFAIYRRFKAGITYTASAWVRSAADTTLAYLRLGNGPGNDKASSSSVALSTTWTQHTVTWTPTADREGAHVAFNIAAATGTTYTIDGVMVYEGTVAPTLTSHTEGRGGQPPVGIIEGESIIEGATITADAACRGGNRVDVTNTFAQLHWLVDPALLTGDDYGLGEIAVEVWARMRATSAVTGATAALLVAPWSPEITAPLHGLRYSDEFGSIGRIVEANAGDWWSFLRLGTVRFNLSVPSPASRNELILSITKGAGGTISVDYLVLVPARSRALSPSGKPALDTPFFIGDTIARTKRVRSDLSGLQGAAPGYLTADSGLGGALLEMEPGINQAVFRSVYNADINPAIVEESDSEPSKSATVHAAVTPRWHLARGT